MFRNLEADRLVHSLLDLAPEEEHKRILTTLYNAVWREIDRQGFFPYLTGDVKPSLTAVGDNQ